MDLLIVWNCHYTIMKIYLGNWESYYYIVEKIGFKRLFVKYAMFIPRFKDYIKAVDKLVNSCDEILIDTTPYKLIEDYEDKLLAIQGLPIASRIGEGIPFTSCSQDTHICKEFGVNFAGEKIHTINSLEIPLHYNGSYGIIHNGWVFHKNNNIIYSGGRLIEKPYYEPRKVSENIKNILINLKDYYKNWEE